MSPTSKIRLHDIRAHEGSQARAWEELVYQVRPLPGTGHVETRKTKAPDAGVEWYEIYADGHEEGFQAKFHNNLADALGGMLESVRAVAGKRPRMTRLTFIVPYDFTDSGESATKSDQDRWNDAVTRWKKDVVGATRLDFRVLRAGDITEKLMLAEHAGRRAYWFGHLELTDAWLSSRLRESLATAGERYTPEADTYSAINDFIDAAAKSQRFLTGLRKMIDRTLRACRQDIGVWGPNTEQVEEMLEKLESWALLSLSGEDSQVQEVLVREPDFRTLAEIASNLREAASISLADLDSFQRIKIERLLPLIEHLEDFAIGKLAALCTGRALAIEGPAGQGKTHSLMAAAQRLHEQGVPTIALLGQRMKDATWWRALSDVLGGVPTTSEEFLQALDSLAEAKNCRAVIIVDALNESESPRRWETELVALHSRVREFAHISLIVSYRNDYQNVVHPSRKLPIVRHPGLAGRETDAMEKYCALFSIPLPGRSLFDPSFSNPLFLRMYCEVLASEKSRHTDPITRSNLFERFAKARSREVLARLELSPSSEVVSKAIEIVADLLLNHRGQPVPRAIAEQKIDALLPIRQWPKTLFQQLGSEGLLELRPTYDGEESVSFPFQAYSEHLLGARLIEVLAPAQKRSWWRSFLPGRNQPQTQIAIRLRNEPWLWRAMAVLLPERLGVELSELLPDKTKEHRLREALRQSLVERSHDAFGMRAHELLEGMLVCENMTEAVDTVLSLAPRESHPANGDWLHQRLIRMDMPTRDASWSIASYDAGSESPAFRRLTEWARRVTTTTSDEEIRLASLSLMWLLSSPNRFLRDSVTKTLAHLLSSRLLVSASLLRAAREVDDPYVQERVFTSIYGAVMVGGETQYDAVELICEELSDWANAGLPVNVLARDSARGTIAWARYRGIATDELQNAFLPPYGSAAPTEPPTADELRVWHGHEEDKEGDITRWRAFSILDSCLDWMGDFNKYVVKSHVGKFSKHPLLLPVPCSEGKRIDPLGEVEGDWAGRWIAHRALEMGWTEERFGDFEREHWHGRGRDSHKAERFGKKYQWMALHELLGRLADNYHLTLQPWDQERDIYQGPWIWYGRDIDPSLPPSVTRQDNSRFCDIAQEANAESWASIASPDLDTSISPDEWVANTTDLPSASAMFESQDIEGKRWIALQRYCTWNRKNDRRTGISKRVRDVFFLQFAWLTPKGQGQSLQDLLIAQGLGGRWMPDTSRTHTQYLGELGWAPVETARNHDRDIPEKLRDAGIEAWPAVEQYLWEGNTLDCSLDENVDFYMPTAELLGNARWIGHRAEWSFNNSVVCRALKLDDEENGQDVVLVDADWLNRRLAELNADLVIGTLGERHAMPIDDSDDYKMAFSDISYIALLQPGEPIQTNGPNLSVRQTEKPNT
ncbi:hypothetical protein [Glutamicibacter halophytocola]|uniref:ATP-binding protein n=1 Tax=Glutamicibacter halophytocola TaxID=1933880 RepID=A0AA95BQL7_9MICC|nr:hypothetical protein [Glutamicibacter halophytocola]ALG27970.1 hypothetical protein AOZ07_02415 [Glutamicibacter halophytocola]UUX59486.1 hypothetical protein NUH22_02260 [Glutamicibacter halophytocola]